MALNKYEKSKIEGLIRSKLLEKGFEFENLEIIDKNENLAIKFEGCKHVFYKNVRLMSFDSVAKETTLYTRVYINLRFLYGLRTSPKIGHKIVSFKMDIS